jgi:hypothetical protein
MKRQCREAVSDSAYLIKMRIENEQNRTGGFPDLARSTAEILEELFPMVNNT